MLKIRIDNKYDLDIQDSFSLTRVVRNPLFFINEFQGNVSYDLEISAKSDHNRFVLGFIDEPFIQNSKYEYDCLITFSGMVLMQGTMVVYKSKRNVNYSAYVKSESALFNNAITDKSLNDFNYNEIANYNNTLYYVPYNPSVDFHCVFPISSPKFYENRLTQFESSFPASSPTAKDIHQDNRAFIVNSYNSLDVLLNPSFRFPLGFAEYSISRPAINICTEYTSFPFLRHLIEYLISKLGFVTVDNFFAESEQLRSICMFLNWGVTNVEIATSESIQDSWAYYWTQQDGDTPSSSQLSYMQKMPSLSLKDFFLSIQNYFNLFINVSNRNDVAIKSRNDFLLNNTIDDWNNIKIYEYEITSSKSKFILSWEDDGADDSIDFKELDLTSFEYKGELANDSLLPPATFDILNDFYYIQDSDSYKQCNVTVQTINIGGEDFDQRLIVWDTISRYKSFQPVTINGEETNSIYEYKSQCFSFEPDDKGTIEKNPIYPSSGVEVPHLINVFNNIQGNRSDFIDTNDLTSMRFMMYHGVVDVDIEEEEETVTYELPYGSKNSLDIQGNAIAGYDIDFKLSEMYKKYWQQWAQFIANGKEFTALVYLNERQLSEMDILKKKTTRECTFFIKEIRTPINFDSIGESTIIGKTIT